MLWWLGQPLYWESAILLKSCIVLGNCYLDIFSNFLDLAHFSNAWVSPGHSFSFKGPILLFCLTYLQTPVQVIQNITSSFICIFFIFLANKSKILLYDITKKEKNSIFFTIYSTSLKLGKHMCLITLYYHILFHFIINKSLCFITVRSHSYITWLFQGPPPTKNG